MLILAPLTNGAMYHHSVAWMEIIKYCGAFVDGKEKVADCSHVWDLQKPRGWRKIFWAFSLRQAYRIVQAARSFPNRQIFCVNGEFLPLVFFVCIVSRLCGVSVAVSWHDVSPHSGKWSNYLLWFGAFLSCLAAKSVVVHSPLYHRVLKKILPWKKITYLPLPHAHIARFAQITQASPVATIEENFSGAPFFSFLGHVHPYKGIHTILPVFLNNKKHRLLIAGSGDPSYTSQIRAQIVNHPNIFFYDKFLSDAEFVHYLSRSQAILLPYVHASQSSLPYIIAHFQVPIIATKGTGITELVESLRGYTYAANDTQGLERLLDQKLERPVYDAALHRQQVVHGLTQLGYPLKD